MSDAEKEAMLRRAFVDGRADFITVPYNKRYRAQLETAAYGEDQGWLKGEFNADDVQSTRITYRLTEKGREYFGITT